MSLHKIYFLGFIFVCLLLTISIYLQVFDGFTPCPLCTLQRLCFALLGIWFFFGMFLHRIRIGRILINTLSLLTATLGGVLAGRQIWLQHYPSADANECGVSLQYMMQALPFNEVMQKVFTGSAECTQRGWEFFSLSMAEWSLLWFVLFFMLSGYLLLRKS